MYKKYWSRIFEPFLQAAVLKACQEPYSREWQLIFSLAQNAPICPQKITRPACTAEAG